MPLAIFDLHTSPPIGLLEPNMNKEFVKGLCFAKGSVEKLHTKKTGIICKTLCCEHLSEILFYLEQSMHCKHAILPFISWIALYTLLTKFAYINKIKISHISWWTIVHFTRGRKVTFCIVPNHLGQDVLILHLVFWLHLFLFPFGSEIREPSFN